MKIKKILRLIGSFVFPPRCMSCGKLIDVYDASIKNIALCKDCFEKFSMAKAEVCEFCNMSADMCLCGIEKRGINIDSLPKVFYYQPKRENCLQNKLIYSLKHKNDVRYARFLADELSISLTRYFALEEVNINYCIFTYIPRRKSAVLEDGFDQGKRIAKALSDIYGIRGSAKSLFVRHGGKEQKKLSANERRANIKGSISLKKSARKKIKNRTVVIVDDLVTSGATLGYGKKLIEDAKGCAICASVAKTRMEN